MDDAIRRRGLVSKVEKLARPGMWLTQQEWANLTGLTLDGVRWSLFKHPLADWRWRDGAKNSRGMKVKEWTLQLKVMK